MVDNLGFSLKMNIVTKIPLLLLLSFWKKNAPKNIVAHRLDHTTLTHYIKHSQYITRNLHVFELHYP
jgi:hypothetical protein